MLRNGGTRSRRPTALVLLVVVLIAAALAAQTAAGKSLLRHAGLIGGRESYTALAFENPRNLPADLRGHPSLRVAFTEQGADWIPSMMGRLDDQYSSPFERGITELLALSPS